MSEKEKNKKLTKQAIDAAIFKNNNIPKSLLVNLNKDLKDEVASVSKMRSFLSELKSPKNMSSIMKVDKIKSQSSFLSVDKQKK